MLSAILWKEFREQGLIGLTLIVLGLGVLVAAAQLTDPPLEGASPGEVLRYFGMGRLATLALAVTAGMVCGAAIFAAERETGTMTFLVSLPSTYRRFWRAKLVAGLLLTVIQIALLLSISAVLGLVNTISWAMTVALYSLLAFVWGMFGSTLARTSLGSVGLAVPCATVTACLVITPILLLQPPGAHRHVRLWGQILFLACMFTTPLVLSYRLFTRPDRNRLADEKKSNQIGIPAIIWLTFRQLFQPGLVMSLFALLLGLGLLTPSVQPILMWPSLALAAGVLAGTAAFADEQFHGAARFWSEQRLPLGRVWVVKILIHLAFGLWLLCLAASPSVIQSQFSQMNFASPHYGRTILAAIFRSPLFDQLDFDWHGWKFLLTPAVYGFAAGHLCGLTFRKMVVACGVAGVVGGVGAALWVPSLLSGGVNQWQLWLPPAICIVTGRMLMRPWSADRLMERTPILTLITGSLATILAMFVGIGYRVLEVPDSPTGEDDIRFVAKLPPYDENIAGREFKAAADRYAHTVATLAPTFERTNSHQSLVLNSETAKRKITDEAFVNLTNAKVPEAVITKLSPLKDSEFSRTELTHQLERLLLADEFKQYHDVIQTHVMGGRTVSALERLEQVPFRGWPTRDSNLNDWLDRLFAPRVNEKDDPPWHEVINTAAEFPTPGIFEHPLLIDYMGVSRNTLEFARQMSVALLARGLQFQSRGDSAAFFRYFRTVIKLAQSMRNGTTIACFETAVTIERGAFFALDLWLENLPPAAVWLRIAAGPLPESFRQVAAAFYEAGTTEEQSRLLKSILSFVVSYDPTEPFDPTKQFLVERHIIREAMRTPVRWLPQVLSLPPEGLGDSDPIVELVSMAWTFPWEKERTRRIVGMGFESGKAARRSSLVFGRPGHNLLLRNRTPEDLFKLDQEIRTQSRASILKLAITIYWYEKKENPHKLGALLDHGYLQNLPRDPYDMTRSFGYRISAGEQLHSTPRPQSERMPFPREELNEYTVAAGQAIVWSVGPDGKDQGGVSPPALISNLGNRPEDAVYPVPLGPSRR